MMNQNLASALHRIWNDDLSRRTESSLTEALRRARRLVSDRLGIIAKVEFQRMRPNEPSVYWAHSSPSRFYQGSSASIRYHGFGLSMIPERAAIKAIGESVERYCAVPPTRNALTFGTYASVNRICPAIKPEAFTLFSDEQYDDPAMPFARPSSSYPLHWVGGTSLVSGNPVLVPASFVFTPYDFEVPGYPPDPRLAFPISTGLACGPTYAAAVYRGLLEIIERDAFMLSWRHERSMPLLELGKFNRPLTRRLRQAVGEIPVSCVVKLATVDIAVTVVLVMLNTTDGKFPLFAMGAGADFDPEQALILALEEALLCYCGLCRIESPYTVDERAELEEGTNPVALHGLAHALDTSLRDMRRCLEEPTEYADGVNRVQRAGNLGGLIQELNGMGHEAVAVDLTQPDIDDAGFKVVRVLVPGLQPLDVDKRWPYLGTKRFAEMTERLGETRQVGRQLPQHRLPHPFA